jgi:hypothetical protein
MRENCTYGSVRGVLGNQHPYRDQAGFDLIEPAFSPGSCNLASEDMPVRPEKPGLQTGLQVDANLPHIPLGSNRD